MGFFKIKRRQPKEPNLFMAKLVMGLNIGLQRLALWLQYRTSSWSIKKKKAILFLFCFAFTGESIYIIFGSFGQDQSSFYKPSPIIVVPLVKENVMPSGDIRQLDRIHRYKVHLDSLTLSPAGRLRRDSLLSVRPHLMDTLNYLENLYYEQQKNKLHAKQ